VLAEGLNGICGNTPWSGLLDLHNESLAELFTLANSGKGNVYECVPEDFWPRLSNLLKQADGFRYLTLLDEVEKREVSCETWYENPANRWILLLLIWKSLAICDIGKATEIAEKALRDLFEEFLKGPMAPGEEEIKSKDDFVTILCIALLRKLSACFPAASQIMYGLEHNIKIWHFAE
jgi:hypothetical protein